MEVSVKKKILILVSIMALSLSGCASVIDLTTEEEDMVAGYAAQSVVNMYLRSIGLGPEESTPDDGETFTEQNESESATTDSSVGIQPETDGAGLAGGTQDGLTTGQPGDGTQQQVDNISGSQLQEVLNVTGVEVAEMGYIIAERYPMEEYTFTVEAGAGRKLLVIEYDVWNSVDADSIMELDASDVVIKAKINGEKTINIFKTMLNTDILNMNGTQFVAGEAKTGALIFLIDDEWAEKIKYVELQYAIKEKNSEEQTENTTVDNKGNTESATESNIIESDSASVGTTEAESTSANTN